MTNKNKQAFVQSANKSEPLVVVYKPMYSIERSYLNVLNLWISKQISTADYKKLHFYFVKFVEAPLSDTRKIWVYKFYKYANKIGLEF